MKFVKYIGHKLGRKLNSQEALLSPTPHLTVCNDSPTDEEFMRIRQAIAAAVIRQQVQNGKLFASANYAQSLQEYIQVHRAVLSPIRRLPPELLSEIFMKYHERSFDPFHNRPPWKLAHVCQRWRQAALVTAQLWRHLPRMVLGMVQKDWEADRLAFLLQHSFNAEITFYLSNLPVNSNPGNDILTLLLGHCERWESISLVVSEDVYFRFTEIQGRLRCLTRLEIDIIARHGRYPFTMFKDAPKLREISLGRKLWSGSMDLPWKQITSFHEYAPHFERVTRLLSESSSLEKLDVELVRDWGITSAALPSPKILPYLTSLALRSSSGSSFTPLLSKLTLPALTEVFFGRFTINTRALLDDLAGMIERSNCSLQCLTIHFNTRDNDITGILSLTPQLKILDIIDFDQHLGTALCARDGVTGQWVIVPQLETLTCWISLKSHFGLLTHTRCNLNTAETDQYRRLKNLFVVSSSPLFSLADLGLASDVPGIFRVVTKLLEEEDISTDDTDMRKEWVLNLLFNMERFSVVQYDVLKIYVRSSFIVDSFPFSLTLWLSMQQYERFDHTLRRLASAIPHRLQQEVRMKERLEGLFEQWAVILENSSSEMTWIWGKHGYLAYVPGIYLFIQSCEPTNLTYGFQVMRLPRPTSDNSSSIPLHQRRED